MYTFFEPELPSDASSNSRTKPADGSKLSGERRPSSKLPASRSGTKSSQSKAQRSVHNAEKKMTQNHNGSTARKTSVEKNSWNVLDLNKDNYFSCAVARMRTSARFVLQSSDEVVSFLTQLAESSL